MALFELESRTWSIINMLGEIPSSRWNHNLMVGDNHKIMIFGGKNLMNYCKANICTFTTDKAKIEKNI